MGFDKDYAINNKLTPFISMQNHYSLVYREEEREMFPTLKVRISSLWHIVDSMNHIWIQHFGVGSIPWSPLARGVLTRPNNAQTKRSETDSYVFVASLPYHFLNSHPDTGIQIHRLLSGHGESCRHSQSVRIILP